MVCRNVWRLLSYSNPWCSILLIIVLGATVAILNLGISEWVRIWMDSSNKLDHSYPTFYLILTGIFLLAGSLWSCTISLLTLSQAQGLHSHMLKSILSTKMHFFDSNPVGRILSRFAKDIGVVDLVLAPVTDFFIYLLFRNLSILVLICFAIPFLLIPVSLLVALLLLIRIKAMRVSNNALKLELISRSTISTQLGSSLSGLSTIRAF